MASTNDVYRKIKEISKRTANPRPLVQISSISQELHLGSEEIIQHLTALKEMRLINYDTRSAQQIRLTLLGNTVNR